jgi:hypothetical protein
MSRRHHLVEQAPLARVESRAKARRERQRISAELTQLAGAVAAVEPDDVDEPGPAWRPPHHHDAERAKKALGDANRQRRHWKQKAWKRRSAQRRAEALAWRLTG